jgi:hypothetical protein
MCFDVIELLACGHDGTSYWESCKFQMLIQAERRNGTADNAHIMVEYEMICGKCPQEKRIVTGTEEICAYCRLYESGERATNEQRLLGS